MSHDPDLPLYTSTRLTSTNFLQWKSEMMHLLMAHGVWPLVETDSSDRLANNEKLTILDQQAQGLILLNVSSPQRLSIPSNANAHQTWTAICRRHQTLSGQEISNCVHGFMRTRYEDGTSMEEHLDKMRDYFSRLQAGGHDSPEMVKAIFILHSLSPSWSDFRQGKIARASTAHPLTVSDVCSSVLQERDRRLNEGQRTDFVLGSSLIGHT